MEAFADLVDKDKCSNKVKHAHFLRIGTACGAAELPEELDESESSEDESESSESSDSDVEDSEDDDT